MSEERLSASEVERLVLAGSYITREALARCVESAEHQTPEEFALADSIREDSSFDIALICLDDFDVELFKFEGRTEILNNYPRGAVVRALEKLPYTPTLPGHGLYDSWIKRFPNMVQPREPNQG